ncbi:MAG: hypothetical protein E7646_03605 [Ruminococcaceae bacterium]|nr:hypothetical protein [Oscillospiraceae bacterium]
MKKLLTLMLVLSMVLVLFAACGGEPAKTQQATGNKQTQSQTGTKQDPNKDEWGRDKVDSSLPADLNFGGETINIYTCQSQLGDLFTEELNDDIINDAVYNRNIKVEEDLGVKLNWIIFEGASGSTDFANSVDAMVFNDTGDYDIAMGYGYFLPSVIIVNTYTNLYDIPYLDFEKPWWNQIYVEQATLNGQMYTCVGDLSLASTSAAGCIFFNKRLADEHYADIGGAEGIYKLVMDGEWTIDKFTELVKDKWIDSDGDGQKSEGDFFGFGSWFSGPIPCDAFQYGMDAPITRDDENGIPYLTYNTERTVNALNKLYTLAYECDGVLADKSYYGNGEKNSMMFSKFINGSMIFLADTLSVANSFRDMKDDYGLLPMPKYDTKQDKYYTSQHDYYKAFAIPAGIERHMCSDGTTTRDYLAGAVLEKLNEESYRTVAPNYFEVVMKYRYIRSEDSEDYDLKVYDMILEGNNFNFGLIYSNLYGNVSFKFRHMIGRDASNDFASMWSSIETDVTSKFADVISYFTEE